MHALDGVIVTRGNLDRKVERIRYDSRSVEPGDLFVAINGPDDRALGFVDDAIERGANVVVLDDPVHLPKKAGSTTFVLVRDARRAMAQAAGYLWDFPADSLEIYGVTGTNGKTTVAHILRNLLGTGDHPVGMIGTFGKTLDVTTPTGYTTPEAPELMEIFAEMRGAGITKVVMEVSSHALALDRVAGVRFAGAIFTNITQDHLDFHTSFEDYFNAKKRLFDQLDTDATAVVNIDDVQGAGMARNCHARVLRYGHDETADIRIGSTELGPDGSSWVLTLSEELGGGNLALQSPLIGDFNIANITAACTMALVAGVEREELPRLVSGLESVPGRMQTLALGNGVSVVIDYAHTPDALENLLVAVKGFAADGNIVLVFGCGGDRDRTKRPVMGEIGARYADRLVLTSDNPRTEDPDAILDDIARGIAAERSAVERIPDREMAIQRALHEATPGTIVVIAGKGHETYQVVGRERLPFDDRLVVQNWIENNAVSDIN